MKAFKANCWMISIFHVSMIPSLAISQGAQWSDEDIEAVKEKILRVFTNENSVLNEYKKLYPDRSYTVKTEPNAPKMLRLGFHSCLPHHKNFEADETQINGCNGCLNPTGMGINMIKEYDADKHTFNGPNILKTNNNGLMYTADILEEIYTNRDFPKNTKKMEQNLMKSGKSRADLWAFAATIAVQWGIENNNHACDGYMEHTSTCGHLRSDEPSCKINLTEPIKFQTGRMDCIADTHAARPYMTSKSEKHPNPHDNGRHTSNFLGNHFNFTARESVAIMGAHSFGKFNSQITYHRYQWTRKQEKLLNNQLFRHITGKPQYFLDCNPKKLVGDSNGNPANITWIVRVSGNSIDGGPFQWFHAYNRCPASNNCSSIIDDTKDYDGLTIDVEPVTPPHCCEDLKEGQKCQPDCMKVITNDETAIAAELGLYYKFETNQSSGQPLGCPGFESKHWNIESWKQGRGREVVPDCHELEDYSPDGSNGEKLHQLVEEFAEDQNQWITDFAKAFQKMISNGYKKLNDTSYSFVTEVNLP